MRKRIFALFCALSICCSLIPAAFALEGEAQRAADTLATLGLLDEADLDLSQPADRLTAVMSLTILSGAPDADSARPFTFSDVPDRAENRVAYALRQGWTTASSETAFGSELPVSANEWFGMLARMLGYREADGDFTLSNAAAFARRIGLASRSYTGMMTFGDLRESEVDALRFPYKDDGETVIGRLVERGICEQSAVNALGLRQLELTARQVADRHMCAVFSMALYDTADPIDESEASADASGFFITPDGIALTNYHSIEDALQGVATLVTGESCMVERVLWYDVDMDLAVIRISKTTLNNQPISKFSCLELVGTDDLRPGDIAYTLSNPLGLGLAVSSGVISATARTVERYSLPCVMNTADISQGSSGGALLNVYGHVVGVTSGAYRAGNSMYLAVPADVVMELDLTGAGETLAEVVKNETAKAKQTETQQEAPEEAETP